MKDLRRALLIACGASVLVVAILGLSLVFGWYQEGTLIALSLTLLAVVWYTYFTYRLSEKKEQPVVVASIRYVRDARDIRVRVHNFTNRYAATRVWVNAEVYGQRTSLGPDYAGETIWHLTPQFGIEGHFPLAKPLQQVGKDFNNMVAEAGDHNATRQLRLSLKVQWEDEEGEIGSYPEHLWYFDFRRNGFVYQVGGFKD